MATDVDAMQQMLTVLMDDTAVAGWDQPHRFYTVNGTLEDPHLTLLLVADGHPRQIMQQAWEQGGRFKPDAKMLGVALATEAWRHLYVTEVPDEMLASVRSAVLALGCPEDELEEAVARGYSQMMDHMPFPSQMPPHLRREVRRMQVVLADGSIHGCMRTRDLDDLDFDDGTGALTDSMLAWLRNERPVPEGETW